MSNDVEVTLDLDLPQKTTVVSCKLAEEISQLTHACIELSTTEYLDLEGALEREAVVHLTSTYAPERVWTLRVGHIDFIRIEEGTLRYVFNLYPALWLLRFTTNTRKFRNMSSEQIISQVLNEGAVAHRFELVRKTETRKYCAQYRETNLDFVLRLLEYEGIYYTFEPDGTMVMADHSKSSDPVVGKSSFELMEAAGALQWKVAGIHDLRKGRAVTSGSATVNDFNWKKPKVSLLRSASADQDAELEIYDYPVGYRRPDQAERLAQTRLEAYRVPAHYVKGRGNAPQFHPARTFVFGAAAGGRFAGQYLLTRIEHEYVNGHYKEYVLEVTEGLTYGNRFHAIPAAIPFRPALVTAHPHIAGCHTGMVRGPEGEEIHTDQYGRYRAQFHWDREAVGSDEDSRWLRNLQETQTGTVLARVGWEQSIAYVNGDPDRPIGFARNINGVMTPEYSQPSFKTRLTIKTPSYPNTGGFNELRLEDVAGQQQFDWHAEKEMIGDVINDRSEHVGNDEIHKVKGKYARTVENDQSREISGDYDVNVGSAYTFNVDNDRDKKVNGDEKLKITMACSVEVANNDKELVKGDRKTKCGDGGAGAIGRAANEKFERSVKGSWTATGDGNFFLVVQEEFNETIKGSKTTKVTEGGINYRVSGDCETTVKGHMSRTSFKEMGFSGKNSQIEVDGNASFLSGKRMALYGKTITLDSDAEMVFSQGFGSALQIKLTTSAIEVNGKMKANAKNVIDARGNSENITK